MKNSVAIGAILLLSTVCAVAQPGPPPGPGPGPAGAAVVGGIIGGVIGGMMAAPPPPPPVSPDAIAWCARRYRSYDPASMTFLGNDGYRHPCP